jgi:hypothetical protein
MDGRRDMAKLIGAFATKHTRLKIKETLTKSVSEITAFLMKSCSAGKKLNK